MKLINRMALALAVGLAVIGLTILAQAQTDRYEALADSAMVENRPTPETAKLLREELLSQRATQTYLWALPLINTLGMKVGSERAFGAGYNVLPVWKKRLDAKTLVTTPNSDVIYAMSYVDGALRYLLTPRRRFKLRRGHRVRGPPRHSETAPHKITVEAITLAEPTASVIDGLDRWGPQSVVNQRQRGTEPFGIQETRRAIEHEDRRQPFGKIIGRLQVPFEAQGDPGHVRPDVVAAGTIAILSHTAAPRCLQVRIVGPEMWAIWMAVPDPRGVLDVVGRDAATDFMAPPEAVHAPARDYAVQIRREGHMSRVLLNHSVDKGPRAVESLSMIEASTDSAEVAVVVETHQLIEAGAGQDDFFGFCRRIGRKRDVPDDARVVPPVVDGAIENVHPVASSQVPIGCAIAPDGHSDGRLLQTLTRNLPQAIGDDHQAEVLRQPLEAIDHE